MSDGVFRDAGAALERVAALEEELARLREATPDSGTRGEVPALRAELRETRVKLEAVTRDFSAVEANYRSLQSTGNAASDDGVRIRGENKRLKDALDQANREFAKLRADLEEAARWEAKAEKWQHTAARLETALARMERENATLKAAAKAAASRAPDAPIIRVEHDVVTEVPPNLQAFMKRLQEERDELATEVRDLEAKLASKPRGGSLLARLFRVG